MTSEEIKRTQERIGVEPDGFWGPISSGAARAHLLRMMPKLNPFPKSRNVMAFYGPHGQPGGSSPPTKEIQIPFTIFYEGKPVNILRPHALCADSLLRVFHRLAEAFPSTIDRKRAGILTYDGLYNPRPMRGSSKWSMHSWAIAIDLNAGQNGNSDHWPVRAVMPIEVMECFAKEGWTAAGAFWSRDAMHFEAVAPGS